MEEHLETDRIDHLLALGHCSLYNFLTNLHHEIQIVVDSDLKAWRHERSRERKLEHRWTFDARAGAEPSVIVDVRVDEPALRPGEENFPPAFFRLVGIGGFSALRLEARLGDAPDGIDADRADLDAGLRVAG